MEPYEITAWVYPDQDVRSPAEPRFKVQIRTEVSCPHCKEEVRIGWVCQGHGGRPFMFFALCRPCDRDLVRWHLAGFKQKAGR